jgi:hypothetical protein
LKVQADLLQVVKTIFFAAQYDDFRIISYVSYRFGVQRGSAGRNSMWERMAEDIDLVGVCCIYFGEDENVLWIIEVYEDYRKKVDNKVVTMRANGRDMYATQILIDSLF